jgi:hypothetical protein
MGGTTQAAPGIALGPAAGIYSGPPLPLVTASHDADSLPLFIKLWTVRKFRQSTARPGATNMFNLTLRPTAELAIGTTIVITGIFGVTVQDFSILPPDGAAVGTLGLNLNYAAGSPLFGTVAAFDPVGGTLTLTTGLRWLAAVQSTVTFSMVNGPNAQLPTNATIAATAPVGSGASPPPPVISTAELFESENCERRPFFINSIELLFGPDGDSEEPRLNCIEWNSDLGRLTFSVAAQQSISAANAPMNATELNSLAAATAFRLQLTNGGSAQVARTISLQMALAAGPSPSDSVLAAAKDSNGGPLQIRMWQTATAAQVSSLPGSDNAIALALSPEIDLPSGSVIVLTGLSGTAAYFPDSLQVIYEHDLS